MLLRRRRAGRRHARRRGARRDPARSPHKPVLVLANKIDDPAQEPLALELHRLGLGDPLPLSGMHGHGTGDLLDEIVARLEDVGEARPAVGDEAIRVAILGRPNVGKSSLFNALIGVERTIVSEVPGHDARLDRHRARARRARRSSSSTPPGLRRKRKPAAGDRVLLGAARARGGRARRRRARPDRRERGDRRGRPRRRRRRAQGAVLDARRPLEVGPLAGDDRGRPARARSAACASGRRSSPPRRRPGAGSRACSTGSASSTRSTRAGSATGELNRFLGELKEARQPPSRGPQAAEPPLRRAGRDAAAALPLHRQRHEPRHPRLRLLGRERAARAVRDGGRPGRDRLPPPVVKTRGRRRRRLVGNGLLAAARRPRPRGDARARANAEDAAAIRETGRNPRFLPDVDLAGVARDDDRRGARRRRRPRRRRAPEPRLRLGRRRRSRARRRSSA